MKFLFVVVLTVLLISSSQAFHQFGKNNRTLAKATAGTPWKKIGKLVLTNGGSCTAFLIGKNIGMTASHCFHNQKDRFYSGPATFMLGYDQGRYLDIAVVKMALPGNPNTYQTTLDWAVFELTKPAGKDYHLGDKYGYFEVNDLGFEEAKTKSINNSGYPGDMHNAERQVVHTGCEVRDLVEVGYLQVRYKDERNIQKIQQNLWAHDCDSSQGSSGSPVYYSENGRDYVVGIHVSEVLVTNRYIKVDAKTKEPLSDKEAAAKVSGEFEMKDVLKEYSKNYANFANPVTNFYQFFVQRKNALEGASEIVSKMIDDYQSDNE